MNLGLKWGTALMLALATAAAPAIALADNDRRGGHGHRDHDRRGHDSRRDNRDHRRNHRQARLDNRYDRRDDRYSYNGRDRRPAVVVHHRPVVRHYHPAPRHHAGPPRWARGGYVHHYQRPVYVVNDYYGHGLRHPPRGHRWMRDDHGDFLLVAIATGVIADLLLR
ncbi:RcnB family protein [Luteimonas sp. A482]